eukprot:gb/GFBE01061079.1/.p1 GENE.gb/GFBE01061079.1/~~gb/GFBE01061079.1/.p1  ORF type:complete len:198 (+),score=34.92 gb/GFBE01061079.1/:1-594(+)
MARGVFDWKASLAPAQGPGRNLDWKASLTPIEVKNTFIHFAESEEREYGCPDLRWSRRTASSPPCYQRTAADNAGDGAEALLATAVASIEDGHDDDAEEAESSTMTPVRSTSSGSGFNTSHQDKLAAHEAGTCKPCAYFRTKVDGCQRGDDCTFCHLCTWETVRQQHINAKRQARAQKRAATSAARAAARAEGRAPG